MFIFKHEGLAVYESLLGHGADEASIRPVSRGAFTPCKHFRPPWKNMLGIVEKYWTKFAPL